MAAYCHGGASLRRTISLITNDSLSRELSLVKHVNFIKLMPWAPKKTGVGRLHLSLYQHVSTTSFLPHIRWRNGACYMIRSWFVRTIPAADPDNTALDKVCFVNAGQVKCVWGSGHLEVVRFLCEAGAEKDRKIFWDGHWLSPKKLLQSYHLRGTTSSTGCAGQGYDGGSNSFVGCCTSGSHRGTWASLCIFVGPSS